MQKRKIKYWDKIPSFFGDKVLQQLLIEVRERLNDIYLLITELPTYTPIIKETHEFHSLFDTQTSYFIFIYLVYSVFYEYIVCSNNPDLLYTDFIETKKQRKQPVNHEDDLTTINVTSEEDMDELDDIQIEIGNQEELKKRVAKLLLTFVDLENENQVYFVSYKEIMKKAKAKNKIKAPKPLSSKVMDAVSALSYSIIHLGSDSPSAEFIFESIQSLYKKKEVEDILELVETEVFFIYDN
ncbi:MAG: hypothetical protein WCK36_00755, partial [Candidatus Firestonebacteria bacterium]